MRLFRHTYRVGKNKNSQKVGDKKNPQFAFQAKIARPQSYTFHFTWEGLTEKFFGGVFFVCPPGLGFLFLPAL